MGFNVGKIGKSLGKVASHVAGHYVGSILGGTAGGLSGITEGFGGGLSGLTGWDFVSGAVGLGQDELAAQQQWKYSRMASDYAFNQNLKMWNLQNAYNHPSAQMSRLKEAGLNPNLVYGGGNVTGNTSGNAPQYDTPKVSYEDRTIQREQLRLALQEHQQAVTNQAIENDLARQRLVLQERDADRSDALAQAQISAYKANLGMIDANIGNIEFNQNNAITQRAWDRYKHDVDAYDKAAASLDSNYNIGFTKAGFGAKMSGKQKAAQRKVVQILGFRPVYRDYLNGIR